MTGALLAALVPIALLIGLGAALRRKGVIAEVFWPQAERLCYYLLLPALFFHGLATAKLDGLPVGAMAATLIASTLLVAIIVALTRRYMTIDGAGFTSVFQGSIRFNNYVGIAAAASVLGAQGVALAAVANATLVPTVNILCVLAFARHGDIGTVSAGNVFRQLLLNPLVVACFLGILMQVSGLSLPDVIGVTLKSLGQASLPLGLLCVGAALEFSSAKQWTRQVAIASSAKFVLMPMATVLACHVFHLNGVAATTALIFQSLPTASSSYIMARQLGGNAPLMAGIIAAQTLIAAVALPLSVLMLLSLL